MANFQYPYVVMRRAPMIGRPESKARISVACRRNSLVEAISDAVAYRGMYRSYKTPAQFWIIRNGKHAHLPKRAR